MAFKICDRIKALSPYEPINGEYKTRLDANESFIKPSAKMLRKISKSILKINANRYPDPLCGDLCKAFAKVYNIDEKLVTAGNGSDELISLIISTFFDIDDELVTLSHDFSMYRIYAQTYGVKVSVFEKEEDLTVNTEKLAEYINKNGSKAVVFSNPCNPTSLCISKEDIIKLVKAVPDCLCIVDEAYMDFSDDSVLCMTGKLQNLMVLKTCSKAIGMAAIRLGFAIASPEITTALKSVKSPYNVNSLTQAVGTAVLSDKKYLEECKDKIIKSRDDLYASLLVLNNEKNAFEKIYPSKTNFIFIKTSNAGSIFNSLLDCGIAVRNMGGYLRITAGSKDENEELICKLKEII